WPDQWPFEQAKSSYQYNCLVIDLVAHVDVPMDELFNAMAQPEKLGEFGSADTVFVAADDQDLLGRRNTNGESPWVIKGPTAKILHRRWHLGRMTIAGDPPLESWTEFVFSRQNHSIFERPIAVVIPGKPFIAGSTFSLSVEKDGAA